MKYLRDIKDWEELKNEVIVGDCLEGMKLIPDKSVDAVITDPPFGVGFKYNKFKDKSNYIEYYAWLKPFYNEILRIVKDGGFIAIWQTQLYFQYFWDWFGDDIRIYISTKNFVQLRNTAINYAYDPVILKYKEGACLRPEKPSRNVDFFNCDTASLISNTNRLERKHPCPRPIEQVKILINNFTVGTILDPFMGSWTTARACKDLGRDFIGFELEEDYCKIGEERLRQQNLF